jgi:hypothetical protein
VPELAVSCTCVYGGGRVGGWVGGVEVRERWGKVKESWGEEGRGAEGGRGGGTRSLYSLCVGSEVRERRARGAREIRRGRRGGGR